LRRRRLKQALYGGVGLTAALLITAGVARLQPAAPSVERGTVWIDTVKKGPMLRQVRGSGTLVPEEIRWIPSTTAGRVEVILLRPGAIVRPDTVIVEMSNPDLQQSVKEAQLAYQSAQAAFVNRKAELDSTLLAQQSDVASIKAAWTKAALNLKRRKSSTKTSSSPKSS
jgi:HlyD family secretion protein